MDPKNRNILIIDDEEAILFAFKDLLDRPGLTIDTAQSFEEAEKFLANRSYQGAVIDLRLNGTKSSDGYRLITNTRERNPHCKIILFTAYASPDAREKAFTMGADFFMEKPVSPEEVKNVLTSMGVL